MNIYGLSMNGRHSSGIFKRLHLRMYANTFPKFENCQSAGLSGGNVWKVSKAEGRGSGKGGVPVPVVISSSNISDKNLPNLTGYSLSKVKRFSDLRGPLK